MPRTIFRATDRRRSSRLGAAAAPDVPEMDMLHKRRGVCPGMRVRVRACPHMHGPKAHQGDPRASPPPTAGAHASGTAPRGPTARAPFGRPPRAGGAHRAPRTAQPTGVGALRQEPGSARRRASTRHLRRFPHGRATRAPRCCKGGQQHARHHFAAAPGRGGTRRFNPARAYVPETGRVGAGGRRCSVHRALARAGGAIDRHGDQLSQVDRRNLLRGRMAKTGTGQSESSAAVLSLG